ncbi:DNA-binding domain-containing protein [Aggregatibacter actinomycetemcomitans]|uniref:DNA-binding domain-containing protein n=3 Tax=Aggregatibacter actinomycetemcomitans TaxID=714 RepID=UPI0021518373|nr:DNA-binding domain-containing protein [Aggregatibacter actinomycetemcomitans]
MWVELKDLLGIAGLPMSVQGVTKKAKLEGWERRRKEGVQGKVFEYKVAALPEQVQAELILKTSGKSAVENLDRLEIPAPQRKQLNYLPEALWIAYDKATQKKKEKAEHRFKAVCAVTDLVANGTHTITALVKAGERFGESWKTIKRWYYRVKPFERSDWLAVLVSKHDGKHPELLAEFSDEAWSFFKADYLRPERPQFNACYRRLLDAARENNWTVPSISAVKSKLEREVPKIQQIYWRKGEHAVSQLYPSQQRTVADLEAMEWINGDG